MVRLKAELAATEAESAEPSGAATKATAGLSNPYVMRLRETLAATETETKILKAEEQRLRAAIATYQTRLENTPKREQEFQAIMKTAHFVPTEYAAAATQQAKLDAIHHYALELLAAMHVDLPEYLTAKNHKERADVLLKWLTEQVKEPGKEDL